MKNKKEVKFERRKSNSLKAIALSQVFMMVLEIFAFSFIFGGMAVLAGGESVSGATTPYQVVNAEGKVMGDFDNIELARQYLSLQKSKLGDTAYKQAGYRPVEVKPTTAPQTPATLTSPAAPVLPAPTPKSLGQMYQSQDGNIQFNGFIANEPTMEEAAEGATTTYDLYKDGKMVSPNNPANMLGFKPELVTDKGNFNGVSVPLSDGKTQVYTSVTDKTLAYNPATKEYLKNTGTPEKPVWEIAAAAGLANTETYSYSLLPGIEGSKVTAMMGSAKNLASIVEGAAWSVAAWALVKTFTEMGLIPENMGKALGQSLTAGIMAGKTVLGLLRTMGPAAQGSTGALSTSRTWFATNAAPISVGVAIVVAYFVFAEKYTKEKTKSQSIEFKCMAWQAPNGGSSCNKCNGDSLRPCSEYRCRALGLTCKLINQGTGKEMCIDSSPNDVTSPGIKQWNQVISKGYAYSNVKTRPPGGKAGVPSGMKITYNGGCLPAFSAFEFGIQTTDTGNVLQPAQCKVDYNHTMDFDSMGYYLGDDNLYVENHSQRITLPGTKAINSTFPGVQNDGNYNLYIRCKDGNGNTNEDEFVVQFCIDKTPDVTPPVIKATSIASGSAVHYKADNVTIGVYTNEPANCRWSRKSGDYENMENQMSCTNNLWELNAEMLYTCTADLTAIEDRKENQFYFRCQDISPQNNTMHESYPFKLIGTQPLTMLSVGPNGTIGTSTSTAVINLTARTDNGFRNGEATCYYSATGLETDYTEMFDTGGKNTHTQSLDLVGGSYNYYFKCVDAGGNIASNSTSFTIFVDKFEPAILRVYTQEGKLIIATDEESTCAYSTDSCNFEIEKGINMPYNNDKIHYGEWKIEQTYYIKCSDKYGNMPDPSECSMVVRPYALPIEETEAGVFD